MPVPADITAMGAAAHRFIPIQRQFANPQGGQGGRANLTRTFHPYLELAMQAKHDVLFQGYCKQIGVIPRPTHGTQVTHAKGSTAAGVLGAFYATKAGIAADLASSNMQTRWRAQAPGAPSVFTVGKRVDAAIQGIRQSDGYRYEISYWYDNNDIYVLFHCYPG
jgi:hypothetical protein